MKKFLFSLILLLMVANPYAQTPTYELILQNDQQINATEYEFDISIRPLLPTTSFELAQLQLIMTFNTSISSGTLTFYVNSGTSELVVFQQPQQSNLSIVGNELRIFPQTPPGAGNGTIIDTEKRVARFKISSSTNFNSVSADIAWKNLNNPYTRVWAYLTGINTEITNSSNNINILSDPPLPVELTSFSSSIIGHSVKLIWRTQTEVNNYGFEILRLYQNELSWRKIGFVDGNGNSNSPKEYQFVDNSVESGKYLYKLKQIDNDGNFSYSEIVEIELDIPANYNLAQNYPNPFNPRTLIKFSLPQSGFVKLKVYNLLGEELITLINEQMNEGVHKVSFNPNRLNSGVYIYKLEVNDFIDIKKMIYLK